MRALKDRIAVADGLLLATPEYNNSLPGVFKNAIGPMWRAFGEAATAYCSTGPRVDEAVAAAIDSFEAFERGIGTAPGEPRPTLESA